MLQQSQVQLTKDELLRRRFKQGGKASRPRLPEWRLTKGELSGDGMMR